MMWGDGSWGGWVVPGIVVMVICMLLMGRMMGHRMSHGRGSSEQHGADEPERILENRLARGEIDVAEYERLRDVLRRIESPGPT